ncbi:MAG: carbohydrate ABC transporter permease [Candidatus Thorarchaeota archaeon]
MQVVKNEKSYAREIWEKIKDLFGGGEDATFIMVMLVPAGLVFFIGILFPLIYGLLISLFHLDVSKQQYNSLRPENFIGLGNYFALIQQKPPFRDFLRYYVNTLIFTVVTVFFELILGLVVALLLNKKFKGRGIVRAAVLVPWAIPTIVNAKIWQLLFAADLSGVVNDIFIRFGLIDKAIIFEGLGLYSPLNLLWIFALLIFPVTLGIILYAWVPKLYHKTFNFLDNKLEITIAVLMIISGIIVFLVPQEMLLPGGVLSLLTIDFPTDFYIVFIVDIWKTTPFMALLILADLQTVPQDLYKAAEVDGASKWQTFREVTLPLIIPGIGTALIFRCIDAFRVYDILAVFTSDSIASITKVAVNFHSDGLYGAAAAVAIFTFLNIVTFVIFFMWLTRRRGEQ